MLWKCCTQYASKFGKLSSGHRTGKGQFSFQFQRRAMPKNVQTIFHNCIHLKRWQNNAQSSPSQASIVCELWTSDVPAEFRKGREEPENKLPTSVGSLKKQGNSRKTSPSASLPMPKPLTVWTTTNCGKFLKRWNTRTPCLPPEKSVYRSRNNS